MNQGLLPRRYAKALYEVAVERNDDTALYTLMQKLVEAFSQTPGLASTMANPFVEPADKCRLVDTAVYADGIRNSSFDDFVKLLVQNKRLDIIREAALAYIELYRQKNSIYRVDIRSAAPLKAEMRTRLENILRKHIGEGTLEIEYTVDPSLIGGFTVTVNSERLDASVSTELKNLRRSLIS
ncbi:MAG: ATP synthase F1 subunit delta [Muribaculaceae bacterium]|nr:ATP synthase F1 subunit delta [Muribaculaceae bacterium]